MKRMTIRIGVIIQVGLIPRVYTTNTGAPNWEFRGGADFKVDYPSAPGPLPHDAQLCAQAGGAMATAAMSPSVALTHDSV